MSRSFVSIACMVAIVAGLAAAARGQASLAESHLAAARAAMAPAGSNAKPWHTFTGLFNQICTQPKPDARQPRVGPGESDEQYKLAPTPRDQWYEPPMRVFDNLYFIGTKTESTWALTTSAGIILLNTNFPWVTPGLLRELTTFGLDPKDIKYAVIVRSHSDQSWGINPLKAMVPAAHVIMSPVDWDLLARDNTPANLKPVRDMVASDGEKLTLGDTTITLYVTPTSTPGNLSVIFPVKDGKDRHMAGMLGGDFMRIVQEGVQLFPDMATMATGYIASTKRFAMLENAAGVDAIVHIHSEDDNTLEKLEALKTRKPGEPHPFVNKDDVARFMTLHTECAQAQLAWAKGQ